MDVSEENLFAMKRHNMQSVERGGGKVGYMTELVELRFMSVRIRRSSFSIMQSVFSLASRCRADG
jgi:hypothetical protein